MHDVISGQFFVVCCCFFFAPKNIIFILMSPSNFSRLFNNNNNNNVCWVRARHAVPFGVLHAPRYAVKSKRERESMLL